MEHWKPIPGYVGWYEISSIGRVRSVGRWVAFSDGRRRFYRGQLRSLHKDGFGYKKVTLKKNNDSKRILIHQTVAFAFIGTRPYGKDVCHNDGDHLNNTPRNLRYDTRKANHGDTIKHGRQPRGESSYAAKLTNREVLAIQKRRRWAHI